MISYHVVLNGLFLVSRNKRVFDSNIYWRPLGEVSLQSISMLVEEATTIPEADNDKDESPEANKEEDDSLHTTNEEDDWEERSYAG